MNYYKNKSFLTDCFNKTELIQVNVQNNFMQVIISGHVNHSDYLLFIFSVL